MQTDVLIVGAGPTGLMLAIQLARRGVRAVIIDRHSGPAQQSRAMGVQARTLEIYSKLGIAERAIELGRRANAANMWVEGAWRARIPVGEIGQGLSAFPYILMLGQDLNEQIMGELLERQGITIRWNTELIALAQHDDRVNVTLKLPDGALQKVNAAYVCGCDGARSAVRELSGITFPGEPYEQVFFVADTVATGSMRHDELNIYLWGDGFHLFFPMHGEDGWRVIGILPKPLRDRNDLRLQELEPYLNRETGAGLTFKACHWLSTYRSHHRCASRFLEGRCFLLGDAAHIHSPAGAQGMNTGLQDAYNLAWKLALVVQGQADAHLLNSYEAERIPVAQRLLRTTDRAFKIIVSEGPVARLLRTRVMARVAAFAMTRARLRQLAFRSISQIGIRYRRSELSRTLIKLPDHAPRAGDRFPWMRVVAQAGAPGVDLFEVLDDTRFNLVVVGQALPPEATRTLSPRIAIHVIPDHPINNEALARACISGPSFYLLRPDGHIGLAGGVFDAVEVNRYFDVCAIRLDRIDATRAGHAVTSSMDEAAAPARA